MASRSLAVPAFAALAMFAAPLPVGRMASLCTGAGVRLVRVPLDDDRRPPAPDCGKACHVGCDRRKPARLR